jgi:hypothetical protein
MFAFSLWKMPWLSDGGRGWTNGRFSKNAIGYAAVVLCVVMFIPLPGEGRTIPERSESTDDVTWGYWGKGERKAASWTLIVNFGCSE